MPCTSVVGLQWGDEAKGKVVDLLCADHDFVVRYNGGANAGHTIVWGDRKFALSLLPSGVLQPRIRSVIGNGVVVNPAKFLSEVENLRAAGIPVGDNLVVSDRAHVILPYHEEQERVTEQADNGSGSIGTTGRGVGPCYADKAMRTTAVRVGDLLDAGRLRERLRAVVPLKNRLLAALAGPGREVVAFDPDALADRYAGFGEAIRPHVADTTGMLHRAVKAGQRVLFEAAQGSMLDVDHGTYPYVTSSSSTPAGIWSGSGVPARHLTRVIGVVKAYSTRVGKGPLPTELADGPDGLGERIRKTGREYGTVTGRPRRVGWLDAVALRYAADLAGADELALMLLDVLGVVPEVSVAVGYEVDGGRTDEFPSDPAVLARAKPVLTTLPGWNSDVSGVRRLADLPAAARRYVDLVAELVGKPVTLVSVGPDRDQTIVG